MILPIKGLLENFKYEILAGHEQIATKTITTYGINRAGLELAGFFKFINNKFYRHRLILFSNKENEYMKQFAISTKVRKYNNLINSSVPLIILTERFHDETLIRVCQQKNFLLVRIRYLQTSELMKRILDYLDPLLYEEQEIHADLVNIYGMGTLIVGKSGIGKSEAVLSLVEKKHLFVGDDRIIVYHKQNDLYGRGHPILKNLIEVRGIGIIDLSSLLGIQFMMRETKIDLMVQLVDTEDSVFADINRLGKQATKSLLNFVLPVFYVPVSLGRDSSELIQAAVATYKLKKMNIDGATLIDARLKNQR